MADNFKESWKQTGIGLGHAFKDLGKTVIKTAEVGVNKAVEWADRDDAVPTAGKEVVVCPDCQTANPADSKFCSNCGKALR